MKWVVWLCCVVLTFAVQTVLKPLTHWNLLWKQLSLRLVGTQQQLYCMDQQMSICSPTTLVIAFDIFSTHFTTLHKRFVGAHVSFEALGTDHVFVISVDCLACTEQSQTSRATDVRVCGFQSVRAWHWGSSNASSFAAVFCFARNNLSWKKVMLLFWAELW